jgi:hypothetical protein
VESNWAFSKKPPLNGKATVVRVIRQRLYAPIDSVFGSQKHWALPNSQPKAYRYQQSPSVWAAH